MTTRGYWRKSSRSQNTGTCVEVAGTLDRIRDSKNPDGPALVVGRLALVSFVDAVKAGRFVR